jgi:hypothetical protein
MGRQNNVKIYASKILNVMAAPCLRTIPELYIGEKYYISADGKIAQECELIDVFEEEEMVLIKRGDRIDAIMMYEIGANPSWAIRNQLKSDLSN